ncbi:MAG: hypothetical protein JXA71_13785 [Chitinispirillaceae bacterium]|nr:hypothetical protein [Chitinispirillaceae bacterium]
MRHRDFFLLKCALALLVAVVTGFAQESATIIQQKRMAFTRLRESGLSRDEAETFSMYLQIALADATQWEIMDFSVTKALIVERGGTENCTDLQCEIINGQLLSVDYMCFGSIETIGRTFSLNVQVADIGSGRTVANVSKFFKGKEKVFISKVIPLVARQVATTILGKQAVAKNREKATPSSLESVIEQRANQSFSDVRGYLSYGSDSDIETTGKLAFGYFVTGRHMVPDDALRYSYQLQSYLADVGACAMLYIDEMERLMQLRGGNLQCGNMKCAMNVGRLLGVDYMGYGKIRKFFGRFIVRAYIIDVEKGTLLIKEKRRFRGREIVFLTEVIPQLAYRLGEVLERKVNRGGY